MPFMDHVLSGFIAGLPDNVRIRGITGKWLLREAMKEILPPAAESAEDRVCDAA